MTLSQTAEAIAPMREGAMISMLESRRIQLMRQATLAVLAMLVGPALAAAQVPPPSEVAESAETAAADAGLLRKLFTTLVHDVKHLPARDNRAVLLNGGILTAAVAPFDRIGTERASSSTVLKASFAGAGKALGREWVQGGGALAAYTAGRLWNNPRLIAAGGDLIEAQLVSVTVTQALKFAVGRTRPDGEARSFPSGHASAAFATASTLNHHFGRKAAIPAYAVAIYTSLSRLQANSHYASDLVAGATLGLAIARTATIDVGRQHLQIAPTAVAGGAAVMITASRR
jgi:membrane-associated phospholipid phosphatase